MPTPTRALAELGREADRDPDDADREAGPEARVAAFLAGATAIAVVTSGERPSIDERASAAGTPSAKPP